MKWRGMPIFQNGLFTKLLKNFNLMLQGSTRTL